MVYTILASIDLNIQQCIPSELDRSINRSFFEWSVLECRIRTKKSNTESQWIELSKSHKPLLRVEGALCLFYGIGQLTLLTGCFGTHTIYVSGSLRDQKHESVILTETVYLQRRTDFCWFGSYCRSGRHPAALEIKFQEPDGEKTRLSD